MVTRYFIVKLSPYLTYELGVDLVCLLLLIVSD